jgi:hypothetical protein
MVSGMTQPDVLPNRRLYGMMQHLMIVAAQGRLPDPAPPRDVVTTDYALGAVLQLAAVIDSAMQAGVIPREQADYGAAMLMVIRDYIKPLPVGESAVSTDRVGDDLAAIVAELRRLGGESGVQG